MYRDYLRAKLARLGPLPPDARPLLREAGLLVLDLRRLRLELESAVAHKRPTVARRIDRRLVPMRTQLLAIEERLEELAQRGDRGQDIASQLAQLQREDAR
jgi:hypothetical protein